MGGMADELTLDIEKRFPSGAVVSASFRVARQSVPEANGLTADPMPA